MMSGEVRIDEGVNKIIGDAVDVVGDVVIEEKVVVAKIDGIVVEVDVDVESELLWRSMTAHSPPPRNRSGWW